MEQHLGSETCSQGTKSIPSEGGPQPESWTAGSSEPKIQGKFRVVGKLEQKTRRADRSVFHRHGQGRHGKIGLRLGSPTAGLG